MLTRYQVLLPDWLEDYVKHLVKTYDFSFSEIIRAEICCSIIASVASLYPEHKQNVTFEYILNNAKRMRRGKVEREEIHRALSKIYFYL